ncbi:MAG: HEAT repeat domain-containing protein, partial [Phycisphaeraceae bacterium]|nr:HEAT repeat domain-containing protein [Phycisphaeraceae bacterium]
RTGGSEDASQSLLEGLKTAKTRPLRTTLLSTLGQLKHDSALPVLVAALEDADETIRYNAIKALSLWPNASPASSLLAVARTTSHNTHRTLALRGYISLAAAATLPDAEKLDHYEQAMTLAAVAEKKRILAKLPDLQSTEALRMAAKHLNDPATVNEAAQAATTLAQGLVAQDPDAAAAGMQRVIESIIADSFKQKAQQIRQQINDIEGHRVPATYQTLERRTVSQGRPWAVLERDGASRSVKPYLSSLAQGETATGVIASPEFVVPGRTITFTLCGHDGQGGGRGEDFMALVDADKGRILKKTAPPGNDTMKTFTWDVSQFTGTRARVEVHDGNPGTAYAWLGVGSIDASPAFKIDFSQGMPAGWAHPEPKILRRVDLVTEGVPFRQAADLSHLIPPQGSAEFACGFTANRLFFLGATVDTGEPGACYGGIELHYKTGSPDVFPLICAYTLNALQDLAGRPRATHLHAAGDTNQFYLAITPRQAVIEKIRLVAEPKQGPIPQITAITCETTASHDRLIPLTGQSISPQEANWIHSHSISAESPELGSVMQTLGVGQDKETTVKFKKHQIDGAFRSEGVAVADFNGDGQLDIATGLVYYAGPDWTMTPMVKDPIEFNRYGYSSAFLCFADDVDDDSDMDLIVVGFPGQQTHWLENPDQPGALWKKHLAVSKTGNESPMHVDVNGDGREELLFFNQGNCVMARPGQNPRAPWVMETLSGPGDPAPGHGLGMGDLNDDSHVDVLIPNGWWEAPSDTTSSPWPFHKAELFGGVQMCVYDFDADGDADVLGSSAHGYGIAWTEQTDDGWKIHEIDHTDSQTHAIHLADINGDGLMDFVTGKRFWAHNGHDTGSFQPAVLCWCEQQRQNGRPQWVKHIIDFDSGVGLHFQIVDITGDGRLDIVTSNKKGVHTFEQLSP